LKSGRAGGLHVIVSTCRGADHLCET